VFGQQPDPCIVIQRPRCGVAPNKQHSCPCRSPPLHRVLDRRQVQRSAGSLPTVQPRWNTKRARLTSRTRHGPNDETVDPIQIDSKRKSGKYSAKAAFIVLTNHCILAQFKRKATRALVRCLGENGHGSIVTTLRRRGHVGNVGWIKGASNSFQKHVASLWHWRGTTTTTARHSSGGIVGMGGAMLVLQNTSTIVGQFQHAHRRTMEPKLFK
jgi:hypothetical protein